eukprot:1376224-Pyramimonas_sp.AAC.1
MSLCRSRGHLLPLTLSLPRYNRVGRILRLRRSMCLGRTLHLKLGSGAGRWWPAVALFFAIHGAKWRTTDMVDHQGAVALHGGDHGNRKDTCTE